MRSLIVRRTAPVPQTLLQALRQTWRERTSALLLGTLNAIAESENEGEDERSDGGGRGPARGSVSAGSAATPRFSTTRQLDSSSSFIPLCCPAFQHSHHVLCDRTCATVLLVSVRRNTSVPSPLALFADSLLRAHRVHKPHPGSAPRPIVTLNLGRAFWV